MSIVITDPIVSKPKSRHTGGNSGGHAHSAPKPPRPAVPHRTGTRSTPHPRTTHARTHVPKGVTASEAAQGAADNAQLAAALGGGYAGTQATMPSGSTTWDGAYDQYGLPAGPGSGRGGNPVGGNLANNPSGGKRIVIKNIPHGPAVTYFTAHQRAVYAATHSLAAAIAAGQPGSAGGGAGSVHTPKPPKPPKAPLQLSDSSLLGHDSHVSHYRPLLAVAPVTTRHPR